MQDPFLRCKDRTNKTESDTKVLKSSVAGGSTPEI
jgi:hypothetical protein